VTLEVVKGDLWDYYDRGAWIVIPVNIGWNKNGSNNMGAGVALQAALRWPGLPLWWGRKCRFYGEATRVTERTGLNRRLILFPVKPLRPLVPELSWDQYASLTLIERSAEQLSRQCSEKGQVVLPFVGCGNGGLDPLAVKPILKRYLSSPTFLVVDRQYQRSE
jgi:hypothetical protein